MKLRYLVFLIVLYSFLAFGQNRELKNFKIVSYNVENYFDVVNDSLTSDEEYLPDGIRAWNNAKYTSKQSHIAKVIAAIGGWDPPAIVGLCEIESEKAMRDLTQFSSLKGLGYKYIHHESTDPRGVDVAMMYQPEKFKPIHDEILRIQSFKTRDILYVSGKIGDEDTLNIFVCHFPSRLGGELESEEHRVTVAEVLRHKVDSIFNTFQNPNIVIMGDFNDYPYNSSIVNVLKATTPPENILPKELYNLAFVLQNKGKGSHKFAGEWGMLDQMIVSGNLMNPHNKVSTIPEDMHVFDVDFLLERDEAFLGMKPFRTYNGMRYQGGFSDHLPVILDLWY
ncbi:MAG: endonuclease/exonuclease/phosphatase family protein [Paludibacteraceae bacterium]